MSRPTKSELDRFFSRKPDLPGRYGTASELSRMFPSGFESEVEDEVEAEPWPIAEAVETGLHSQGLS